MFFVLDPECQGRNDRQLSNDRQINFLGFNSGANVKPIFGFVEIPLKCILCDKKLPENELKNHLDSDCTIFRQF